MGQYRVLMSCGHEQVVNLFGKETDRQRKIAYFEEKGLCAECYKEQKEEESRAEGLVFNASMLPEVDDKSGSMLMAVWFSGDTKSHKEEIKSLGGYRWGERKSAKDYFFGADGLLCWKKVIKMENLEEEICKATSIGATDVRVDNGLESAKCRLIAECAQKDWKKRNDKLAALTKPTTPAIIKGHQWNRKTYGRPGNYSIYLDGEKVTITDEQAKALSEYAYAFDEYFDKVQKIKSEKKSFDDCLREAKEQARVRRESLRTGNATTTGQIPG